MRLWAWERLEEEFGRFPELLESYKKLPSSYTTFDEWQETDDKKCDIIAAVIGCKCVKTIKEQQREAMAYRRTVCATAEEWIERFSNSPDYDGPIRHIIRRYATKKMCHRNWIGAKAGVRCYCDTHNH